MAVKLRLTRMGSKKRPTYRIVATDSRRPRDGEYLELIGTYSPVGECQVNIKEEVALKWLGEGAIPTDTVRSLFSKAGIMKKFADSKKKEVVMDLVELTETIVKSLVINEDAVSVKEFPTEEENVMLIQVMVDEADMGRVIGREGRCANSIRTLVQASSALKENKYIKIDIDKF